MDYIACLVEFGGHNLNGFTPNSTGRISNSTGQLVKLGGNSLYASLVKLGIIPMNSTGIYLNGFTPNLTGHKLLVKLGGNSLR